MKSLELKRKYIEFFKRKGHKEIPNASLIPENDPTVLFTTAGMHPLIPYLIGEEHPKGKRLVNIQRCLRTGDIEEVGDDVHLTFFEMLGNWSLGDYWKKEAIKYSYEFLTEVLKFPKERLAISVFKGDKDSPKDEESYKAWINLGISKERVAFLGKNENWWGPAGKTGPCGPDTEMFYYIGRKVPKKFNPKDKKWIEIWNDVFMQYYKDKNGKLTELKQKNVDTGMGVERVAIILEKKYTIYETSLFLPILNKVKKLAKIKKPSKKEEVSIRKIVDHLKASVFILGDENSIIPSNIDRGYILRRLIRTAIRHGKLIGIKENFTREVSREVIGIYKKNYPLLNKKREMILKELDNEETRFRRTLEKGLNKFNKLAKSKRLSGKDTFLLFQSYGFPLEMTLELAKEKKIIVDVKGYERELKKHQVLSRTATAGRFGSGLADHSIESTKLHTTTHLLHSALRKVLGNKVEQRGSNITKERLRFDFSFDRKMTQKEIKKVEDLVNKKIKEGIEVKKEVMAANKAKKLGAIGLFDEKYEGNISVFTIGNFSKEICTGPHVKNTKELGKFKIVKEQSSSSGVRRIKAILE